MKPCVRCGAPHNHARSYCRTCAIDYERASEKRHYGKRRAANRLATKSWWVKNGHTAKERHERWMRENADRQREHRKRSNAIRSARLAGAEGSFTIDDVAAQLKTQNSICFWCPTDISGGAHTIDHYIPLARGGSNYPNNIVLACAPCNSSKGNKTPEEFTAYLEAKRRIRSAD